MQNNPSINDSNNKGKLTVLTSWIVSIVTLLSLITSMWVGGEGAASKLGFFIAGSIVVLVFIVSSVVLSIFWVTSSRELEELRERKQKNEEEINKLKEDKEILQKSHLNLKFECENLAIYQKLWDDLNNRVSMKEEVHSGDAVKKDEIIVAFNKTRKDLEIMDEKRKLHNEKMELEEKNNCLHKENDVMRKEVQELMSNVHKMDTDIHALTGLIQEIKLNRK